jgi:hypothetical protein
MDDARQRLERQAEWQKRRAALSWPDKIRLAEAVREWAVRFRRKGPPAAATNSASKEPTRREGQG